ncbi:hypothetical protein HID58_048644, partial [Brassica napus]
FLTPMNTSRRHSYGVPSRCWCGKGVVYSIRELMTILTDVSVDHSMAFWKIKKSRMGEISLL